MRPGDAAYEGARLLYNTRFDGIRPRAIARCTSVEDVQGCVRFAARSSVPLRVRAGGHSYGGWSTGDGLVVDVGPLRGIRVQSGQVTVGAGDRLVDVYAALGAQNVGIPAGSCPTVGLTGLTLGGGIGVLSRAWGLTCDNLLAAEVVTADGAVHVCDERRDPDLFWALRGGGGGNFGIVTSLTLRTRPVGTLAIGFVTWPRSRAATVVRAWQSWIARAPDALWSAVHLDTGDELLVHAVQLGDAAALQAQLDQLIAAIAVTPRGRTVLSRAYGDAMLLEGGCAQRTVSQCHLAGQTADAALERETYAAKSAVVDRPLSDQAIAALIAGIDDLLARSNAGSGAVLIDSLGGAVGRVAADATAFPHRSAFAVIQLIASWDAPGSADATLRWLRDVYGRVRPLVGSGTYVNYSDPDLADWPQAYYGANYARLQRVKAQYDPSGLFTFPQAIA